MKKRDIARDFIQTCFWIVGWEPIDDEFLEHLNVQCRSGASMYDWINVKVVGTYLVLSIKVALRDVDIAIDNSSEWSFIWCQQKKKDI